MNNVEKQLWGIWIELTDCRGCYAPSMFVILCFFPVCVNRFGFPYVRMCVYTTPEQQSPQGGLLLKSRNE